MSLFQRKSAGQCYIGLKVDWVVRFLSIDGTAEENVYRVIAYEAFRVSSVVRFDVDISKYPEFKILRREHKLRVWGEISEAAAGSDPAWIFTLSNPMVKVE